jgi:hypothetical protein
LEANAVDDVVIKRVVLSAIRSLDFTFVRYGGSTLPSPRSLSSAGEVGGRALQGIKGSATYRASCALGGQNTASVPQAQSGRRCRREVERGRRTRPSMRAVGLEAYGQSRLRPAGGVPGISQ